MKKTFKILSLFFLSALSLSSCSSDDSGSSNGTTTGDYYPMAVNNKWDYTDGSASSEIKLIGTAAFNGITYYEMTDTNNSFGVQLWMTKKGASYFQKTGTATETQGSITIVIQPYEMKILQDELAVGESWHGSASPKVNYSGSSSGSFTAHINYDGVVTARGVSETLGGNTYNDIIKVELTGVINANGQISNITGEYWFAKDIGLIYEHETSTADGSNTTRYLTSYELH